ncbi:hypothetical protein ACN20G_01550 [Streptomyces sp. BI20]|uniref:hypothetical protein n=1 Tax=Streptomyces sp. BI20 TaxID=3403460 RepID=UPI003C716B14
MAWLYAEYIADELLRTGRLIPAGSVEFRAGRDTLALTVYLSDVAGELSGIRVVSQLDEWLSLTAYGHPWRDWVETRFLELREAERSRGVPDPDLALAETAWRWLDRTELLATDLGPDTDPDPTRALLDEVIDPTGIGAVDESARVWTPAWQLGLPLGHLAMHLF